MKTESDRLGSLAEAVANAVPDFDERIALETYRRLAEGSAAPASDIAVRAGAPVQQVEELLSSWPGVYLDEAKNVVGFWGLTIMELSPTHRLEVDGRNLFARGVPGTRCSSPASSMRPRAWRRRVQRPARRSRSWSRLHKSSTAHIPGPSCRS